MIINLDVLDTTCTDYDIDFFENIFSSNNFFIEIFTDFLFQSFNFKPSDIVEALSYSYKFFNFKFDYELPLITQAKENIVSLLLV